MADKNQLFSDLEQALAAQEFESSGELAATLRGLSASQRRLLGVALEFAYDKGYDDTRDC
jgi:hypothetical protein